MKLLHCALWLRRAGAGWLAAAARPTALAAAAMLAACASTPPSAPAAGDRAQAQFTFSATPGQEAVPSAVLERAASDGAGRAAAASPASEQPIAIDPLQPTERLVLSDSTVHTDLWERVRAGYGVPDLQSDLVAKWEQYYAGKPDYVQRMTERGGRYLFHIVEELKRRDMPTELALLPFIESAFNPQAMSRARASGMWQFIPGTGRDYALRQNIFRDDRRDVLASTRAALDYLKSLHGMFGDWQLALAAYNWGQGNVQRAIKRNQAAGLPTDYASLRMPDETRNYYPKLQAVKNIVARPDSFALQLPPLGNHPYFVSVAINRDIDIDLAARLAELPIDEFKQLNPQMNKPVILSAGTPQVLLPYDNANLFVKALAERRGALATWTAWVAPRTMKSAEVAHSVGMSEEHLRQVNNIPKRMLVKSGSTLLVLRDPRRDNDVAVSVADNASLALAPEPPPFKRLVLRAGRRGDSVAAVAQRYRMSVASVAKLNHTSANGRFRRGQTFVVLVPNGAAHVAAADVDAATARAESDRKAQQLAQSASKLAAKNSRAKAAKAAADDAEEDDDTPAVSRRSTKLAAAKPAASQMQGKRAKSRQTAAADDEDDEEDTPARGAAKSKGKAAAAKAAPKTLAKAVAVKSRTRQTAKADEDEDDDEDAPVATKTAGKRGAAKPAAKSAPAKAAGKTGKGSTTLHVAVRGRAG